MMFVQVFTTQRLDTFAALASPSYIALTEEDPIQAAFHLSQKFRSLSDIEGEYKVVYNDKKREKQLDICKKKPR
jgi:hypothetical protein